MAAWIELALAGVVSGLVIGLGALAVTLVFGIARFPNAATGDLMTSGAYGALLGHKATGSLLLGGVAGAGAGAVLGLAAYWLVFRKLAGRAAVSLLVASIGVGFLLRAALGVAFGHSQQVFQLPLVRPWRLTGALEGVRIHPNDVTLAAVALAALALVFGVLYGTPAGRRMRAVADDPSLARVSGVSPERVMVSLWLLAGAVTAAAGAILGVKTVVSPEIGWDMLLPAFAAAILGGIGSPVGAVVAGLLIGVSQELATPFVGFTYKLALAFLVILVVLLVRPRGLFGRLEAVR